MRREAQALSLRPDLQVVTFRGNVATRLAKLEAGEADVTFLAAAGLERLEQSSVGAPLESDEWIPAAAQGVIAIECRADDAATTALLAAIDHANQYTCVVVRNGPGLALSQSKGSPTPANGLRQAQPERSGRV